MSIREIRAAVGYECDLNCPHCYSVRSGHKPEHRPYLPAEEMLTFIEMLQKNCKMESVVLTGGEPLFQPLLKKTMTLAEQILARGLKLRISTHGGGLNSQTCACFAQMAHHDDLLLQVSLDGATGQTHDDTRCSPRAFEKAIRGIQTAHDSGLRVQVRYTLTNHNLSEFIDCYRLCDSLGVESFAAKPLVLIDKGSLRLQRAVPDAESVLSMNLAALELSSSIRCRYLPMRQMQLLASEISCSCGKESLHMTAYGDVFPCAFLLTFPEWSLGRFPEKQLPAILSHPNLARFHKKLQVSSCPGLDIVQNYPEDVI